MSSSEEPKPAEKGAKEAKTDEKESEKVPKTDEKGANEKKDKEGEEGGGFLGKVKGIMIDVGEKVGLGKPTAGLGAIHIQKINLKQADIIVDVVIKNMNPVSIPVVDINYLIETNEHKLASGVISDAKPIPPHGLETIQIPLTIVYEDIKKAYADLNPGTIVPYKVKADLIVDVPVLGKLTLPLEKTGEIPVTQRPDVHIEKINFEKFSFEETVAILHLKLDNKNDFDLGLNRLEYEFWLCDVSIGGAELTKTAKILKNDVTEIDIPLSFRPKDCGSAMWDIIRGKGAGYSIKGHIEVDTPYGDMKLPIEKEGGTTTLKKNEDGGGDHDHDDKK